MAMWPQNSYGQVNSDEVPSKPATRQKNSLLPLVLEKLEFNTVLNRLTEKNVCKKNALRQAEAEELVKGG